MDKLKQIEAFIAVVEHGSMAAAALTQPRMKKNANATGFSIKGFIFIIRSSRDSLREP